MKVIKYRLTTESPVIISESGGISFIAYTKTFIPGSIIRGMLAARMIKEKSLTDPHKDNDFSSLFLSDSVSYGNAYIATPEEDGNFRENWPLPLSLHHKKEDENILIDLLIETRDERNQEEIEQTRWVGGYGRIENNILYTQDVKKQLFFHHEREKDKGIPKSGRFFNYEAISPGQTFIGDIRFDDKDLYDKFLYKFQQDESIFYIGRSKNSQYGRVRIYFYQPENEVKIDFAELVSNRSAEQNSEKKDGKIVLTFISEAILVNEKGEYCTDKNSIEEYLRRLTPGLNLKIEKAFLRIKEVENYVSVWKLRRPVDYAVRAGSCLLLNVGNKEKFIDELNKFPLGIGIRLAEGFGRFVLNWQRPNPKRPGSQRRNNTTDQSPRSRQNLSSNMQSDWFTNLSERSKPIIKAILENKLKEITELAALKKADQFDKDRLKQMSKSCLGRLEKAFKELKYRNDVKDKFLKECPGSFVRKLKDLKYDNSNNLEKLIENFSLENELQVSSEYEEYKKLISPILTGDFKKELENIYFRTLIYALRKIQKSQRKS